MKHRETYFIQTGTDDISSPFIFVKGKKNSAAAFDPERLEKLNNRFSTRIKQPMSLLTFKERKQVE